VGGNGRILVVDDDPQICHVFRSELVKERFEVLLVRRGDEALDFIRSENFDLILLNLNLPDMPGTEFCRAIRALFDRAIIVLTVRSDQGNEIAAFNAGADDYVTKPFVASELLARIRANLRRYRAKVRLDRFASDDLAIDFAERTVTRERKKMRLPRKQYQLLRYLVSRQGESLSHDALLRAVWGPDYREETGLLQVLIMQLRKKIEPDPSKPRYIVTIPFFGYRFESPLPSGISPTLPYASSSLRMRKITMREIGPHRPTSP
jgi:two-component system, OmpR family, KDP operon response regulator KdpE